MVNDVISSVILNKVPRNVAIGYRVVPFDISNGILSLYCVEPGIDISTKNELEVVIGLQLSFVAIPAEALNQILVQNYRYTDTSNQNKKNISFSPSDIKKGNDFLWGLVADAKLNRSSDIHIEVYSNRNRIRFRIDGILVDWLEVNKTSYPALINQIKILANLDISEKRLPQDGRILYNSNGEKFDIRVSILPTIYGEKCVLRLLNHNVSLLNLSHLGFTDSQLSLYTSAISNPNGVILISGPTGSGKTTTLYATLAQLNKVERNILTIEDPIEYTIDGVNQVQLKESIGLTFANALRTFLRQDPDIIMLGEIRDGETAQIAIRSALTGHLVFSTVHTNSAWGTVTRLIDLGVPPYLVAETVRLTMSQRLVRTLCPKCKKEVPFNSLLVKEPRLKPEFEPHTKVFAPVGCSNCFYTGYFGRRAIYEIIPISSEFRNCIRNEVFDIENIARNEGLASLSEAAIKLVKNGETSIDEILPFCSGS
jgi:general secretion pathway protein E/type IV pilus assembly protein PilB